MQLKRASALYLWVMASTAGAQSYGVLVSGSRTDLYAAGQVFQPASGLSIGAFIPFYVNDRLVVRAEAGLSAYKQRNTGDESTALVHHAEANVTALCRFYIDRKASLSLGVQGIQALQAPQGLMVGHIEYPMRSTDACLLVGAAYRWTDRIETGLRLGQGLLPAAELQEYGTAHRRYTHLTLSYLLHSTRAVFTERRKWRSGLALPCRY